jgi:hypothetical protein
MHQGESRSLSLSTFGTALNPFTVENLNPPAEFPRRVTITGRMLSQLVVGVGTDRQQFTEIAPSFTAAGEDVADPGVGQDSFTLTIDYDESLHIGPLLSEALGDALVTCNGDICTLTVAGTLKDGDVTSHTTGGQ